ncbi:MAG: Gfo/Idh/MocA family oxidoreductase [Acidimicrobiales bacterium]
MTAHPAGDGEHDGVRIGMIGYGAMGKAHAYAYRAASVIRPLSSAARLAVVSGRNSEAVAAASVALGFDSWTSDWREVVERPDVDVVDICSPPGSHAEIIEAAARNGKSILCEKPLSVSVADAAAALGAAAASGVLNAICFNYRRLPAVALMKELVAAGEIGDVLLWRGSWLSDEFLDPAIPFDWRFDRRIGGTTISDLGSHLVDLAEWMVGPIGRVCAQSSTFTRERADPTRGGMVPVGVDDASSALVRFTNGAAGVFEVARACSRRPCDFTVEVNGTRGTLVFDYSRLNELRLGRSADEERLYGMRTIRTEHPDHPYAADWWAIGQGVGYGSSFVNLVGDLLSAWPDGPWQPGLDVGFRVQQVCDPWSALLPTADGSASTEPGCTRRFLANSKHPPSCVCLICFMASARQWAVRGGAGALLAGSMAAGGWGIAQAASGSPGASRAPATGAHASAASSTPSPGSQASGAGSPAGSPGATGGSWRGHGLPGAFAMLGGGGSITAITKDSVTVKSPRGGTRTILTTAQTVYIEAMTNVQRSDLKVGQSIGVLVQRAASSNGSFPSWSGQGGSPTAGTSTTSSTSPTASVIDIIVPSLRGKVASVSASNIVVEGPQGLQQTIVTSSSTTYRELGGTAAVSAVAPGEYAVGFGTVATNRKDLDASTVAVVGPLAGGKVTGISGGTISVQSRQGTLKITTSSSTILRSTTGTASLSEVKVGDYVLAVGLPAGSTGFGATGLWFGTTPQPGGTSSIGLGLGWQGLGVSAGFGSGAFGSGAFAGASGTGHAHWPGTNAPATPAKSAPAASLS